MDDFMDIDVQIFESAGPVAAHIYVLTAIP
jgi:hypothetical protein